MLPFARWAGLSLTAVLLSTVFAWGAPPVATPAATPPVRAAAAESITLDPAQGPAGSTVRVHGYGFENCTRDGLTPKPRPAGPIEIRATWEGGGTVAPVTADAAGEFETELTVPSGTAPGSYDVTALCLVNSKLDVTAAFGVTPAPEPTTLALEPAKGAVGTSVSVSGSGFGGCSADGGRAGAVTLTWDGGPLPGVTPARIPVDAGAFTAEFTVPSDADATAHTVTAACAGGDQVSAEQPFTVTAEPGPQPAVTLDPASIRVGGGPVDLAGSGFGCAEVALSWEGEQWATVTPAADGTFAARFDVPSDAAADSYAVRAECTDDPGTGAEAAFTVTGADPVSPTPTPPTPTPPTPTPPTPTPDPDPDPDTAPVGVVVGSGLLGAALLALAGYVFLSHGHRGPRWVRDHVGSRLRPSPAATDVTEPSGTGPPTRSVRLEPHPDPGDQTLKEEDP
ncbi:hypothetical protein EDE04_0518 [Streptomyces sp. 2132.2]|uniref:hypothetical protein n=1 Tax=Streptomyces sp. 2132.2 TaxID=2485161 RepID=UPI000FBC30D0|nr:hypothetical protein [Streptomyces sp. 2132.2]ROQ94106.1 hypothetical protein EDE04_0518 [Streptomyces sp. 2132.2]